MKIFVTGNNIKVGEALTEYVNDSLLERVTKYFEHAVDASVHFEKEAHLFTVDVRVNDGVSNSQFVKSRGQAGDVYAAFDAAAEKVEKQLRRYKRKLKSHGEAMRHAEEVNALMATKYVLSNDGQEIAETETENPLIIAEKSTAIATLTVSDAVMHMNLSNLPALMFINKKTGRVNTVYNREDGNISWVDSNITAETPAAASIKAA